MIDESKVSVMTKIAIYEKNESRDALRMSRYYKNDYVRYNVLKTWVAVTVAFWTIVGSYVYMSFEDLLGQLNGMNYFDSMYGMLSKYVIVCVVYFLFATLVYNIKYELARPGLVQYNSDLRDLIELEGGPRHHKGTRKKHNTNGSKKGTKRIRDALENAEMKNDPFATPMISIPGTKINRVELLRMREKEAQREREQQILENVRIRNERIAAQSAAKIKQQQRYEEDRKAIQEKRKQLEQQQMERMKAESMKRMNRENHMYKQDIEEDKN